MGILTTAYLLDERLFNLILEDPNNFDIINYLDKKSPVELGFDKDWRPIDHGFDKSWEDLLRVLNGTGYSIIANILEYHVEEIEYKYSDSYVRYLDKTEISQLYNKIEKTSENTLKKKCLEKGDVTDYYGEVFNEWTLDYVLGGYDKFIKFIKKAVDYGCYIILFSS